VNQAELRTLTEEWIKDARVLLDGQRWMSAYYVAGYAVECALKSCVLSRMIYTGYVFQDKATVKDCLTHDFEALINLAGLRQELLAEITASSAATNEFSDNWATVLGWDVTSRYYPRTQTEAETLYAAITDDPYGVLRWIQKFW